MLNTFPTRSLREMYDSKAPDDEEETAEDRELRDAEHCDELLHERHERGIK